MPTTTEVEARLRHTAQACEPIVEDLMADAPGPSPIALPGRRRPGPVRWLAAAALVVALACAAVVAVVVSDDRDADVTAEGGTTTTPTSTTSVSSYPPRGVRFALPDGTLLDVEMPDPGRWRAFGTQSLADVEGVDEPVLVDTDEVSRDQMAGRVGGTPRIEEVRPGVSLVSGTQLTLLVLERDGWTTSITVASAGRPEANVPAEIVDALAASLDVTMTELGPVDIVADGLALRTVTQYLQGQGPAEDSSLMITRSLHADTACPAEIDPATERCIDGYHVVAVGPEGIRILPALRIWDLAEGPPVGTTSPAGLTLASLDGTAIVLGLPDDRDWDAFLGSARLAIEDIADEHTVTVESGTIDGWVAAHDAVTEPTQTPTAVVATADGDRTLLVEWPGEHLGILPVEVQGESWFPPSVRETLAAALAGYSESGEIAGAGITVVSSTVDLLARQPSEEVVMSASTGDLARELCATEAAGVRCLEGGTVALESDDTAFLETLEVQVFPPD